MRDILSPEMLEKFGLIRRVEKMMQVQTSKPTGRLDPARFLEGRSDFWLKTQTEKKEEFVKQTLVLNDVGRPSSAHFLSNSPTLSVEYYENLFIAGFEIYVWQQTGLFKVEYLFQLRESNAPSVSHEKIFDALAQLGKAADEIKIIDLFESSRIYNYLVHGKTYSSLKEAFLKEQSLFGEEYALSLIDQIPNEAQNVIEFTFSTPELPSPFYTSLLKDKLSCFKALVLCPLEDDDEYLIGQEFPHLERVACLGKQLSKLKAANLKSLEVLLEATNLDAQFNYISQQHALESLELNLSKLQEENESNFWQTFLDAMGSSSTALSRLTEFTMRGKIPVCVPWDKISAHAHSLTSLKIINHASFDFESLSFARFQSLTSLTLQRVDCSIKDLFAFLEKHPLLQNLTLLNVTFHHALKPAVFPIFPSIKSLTINETMKDGKRHNGLHESDESDESDENQSDKGSAGEYEVELCAQFFNSFVNLTDLSYTCADKFRPLFLFDTKKLHFNYLTYLNLCNVTLDANNFFDLLTITPELKEFFLDDFGGLDKDVDDKPRMLPSFESLSIVNHAEAGYSKISSKNFLALLNPFRLKSLTLEGIALPVIEQSEVHLNEICQLSLSNLKTSFANLIKFYQHAPHLWAIDISKGTLEEDESDDPVQFNDDLPPDSIQLPNIKTLTFRDYSISHLLYLLKACVNLEHLTFEKEERDDDEKTLTVDSSSMLALSSLRWIDHRSPSCVLSSNILRSAPNLVRLLLTTSQLKSLEEEEIKAISPSLKQLNLNLADYSCNSQEFIFAYKNTLNALFKHCTQLDSLELYFLEHDRQNYLSQFLQQIKLPKVKKLILPFALSSVEKAFFEAHYPEIKLCVKKRNRATYKFENGKLRVVNDDLVFDGVSAIKNRSLSDYSLDANTACNPTKSLTCNEYFYPKNNGQPVPNYYRLVVENPAVKWTKLDVAPFMTPMNDQALAEHYSAHLADNKNFFLGRVLIYPNQADLTILPSLTPTDELYRIEIKGEIELYHQEDTGQYAVKLYGNGPRIITFLLRAQLSSELKKVFNIPITPNDKEFFARLRFETEGLNAASQEIIEDYIGNKSLTERINLLVSFCRSFTPGELQLENDTEADILNAMLIQRHGACRHREVIFSALAPYFKIKARTIISDVHRWVEIYYNNQWVSVDLGGYPASLRLKKIASFDSEIFFDDEIYNDDTPEMALSCMDQTSDEKDVEPIVKKTFLPNIFLSAISPTIDLPFSEFIQQITLADHAKNILITCHDLKHLEEFLAATAFQMKQLGKNFNYIPRLSDVLPTEFIAGSSRLGEQLPLNSLLMKLEQAQEGDVLIVNVAKYSKEDVASCNELTAARKLLGRKLSIGLSVILVTLKSTRFSLDLYSRVTKYNCPKIGFNPLVNPSLPQDESGLDQVALYHDSSWREKLCGKICIKGDKISFQSGALLTAIQNQKSGIIIHNPPLHLEECRVFLSLLKSAHRFNCNGEEILLPDNFQIYLVERPYELDSTKLPIEIISLERASKIPAWDFVLNTATYLNFFNNFIFENALPYEQLGWINANSSPAVLVTGSLTDAQWTRLMQHLVEQKSTCKLIFPPDVPLPEWVGSQALTIFESNADRRECAPRWIETNDIDLTEKICCEKLAVDNVTSITVDKDITYNDLVNAIVMENHAFHLRRGIVGQKLVNADQVVILKGELSEELVGRLHTLWHEFPHFYENNQRIPVFGKLIIITNPTAIYCLAKKEQANYSLVDYLRYLKYEFSAELVESFHYKLQEFFSAIQQKGIKIDFNFYQLQQMVRIYATGSSNPILPFILMHPKAPILRDCLNVTVEQTADASEDVRGYRFKLLDEALAHNYLVFIMGPTGSGKTTFVVNEYRQANPNLFIGKSKTLEWATTQSQGDEKIILVLDEVNIEDEGSLNQFSNNKGILIENVYYPLSSAHRIILIGNPHSYTNRCYDQLFFRATAVEFLALPQTYLEKQILTPVLEVLTENNLISKELLQNAAHYFIWAYQWIINYAKFGVATPRNLQHMCLSLAAFKQPLYDIAYQEFYPLLDLKEQEEFCAFLKMLDQELAFQPIAVETPMTEITIPPSIDLQMSEVDSVDLISLFDVEMVGRCADALLGISEPLMSGVEAMEDAFPRAADFESECSISEFRPIQKDIFSLINPNRLVVTQTRRQALLTLHSELEVRQLKLSNQDLTQFAAINGILFEGEPGIGKSEMILEYLSARGCQNILRLPEVPENLSHCYYHLSNITNFADLTPTLLKAFHCGLIMVIDEFSSLPIEKVLNAILMGIDLEGNPATYPGFFIMGTQNPISFVNRMALSPALSNRLIQYSLPNYPQHELVEIASQKGLTTSEARDLAREFQQAIEMAKSFNMVDRIPTFRAFLRQIDALMIKQGLGRKRSLSVLGAMSVFRQVETLQRDDESLEETADAVEPQMKKARL